jgi:hypothetical protein
MYKVPRSIMIPVGVCDYVYSWIAPSFECFFSRFNSYEGYHLAYVPCGFRKPNDSTPRSVSMSQRPIRWHNAKSRRPHAPSIPQRAWEQHRGLLKRMYLVEGMKLEDIMKIMKDEYFFTPSYAHLFILHRKFVSMSFHAALSKLLAFAGGASTHPSSITGGVSTRGQAEAERKRTRL